MRGWMRWAELWGLGYSANDVVSTMFKVAKGMPGLGEAVRLDVVREIGWCHMRVLEGVQTLAQLSGCVARIARLSMSEQDFVV